MTSVHQRKEHYPTRETADVIVDRIGGIEEDPPHPCRLFDKEHPDGVEITIDDVVKVCAEKHSNFDEYTLRSLILDYKGFCIDIERGEVRGHTKPPPGEFGSLYDDD